MKMSRELREELKEQFDKVIEQYGRDIWQVYIDGCPFVKSLEVAFVWRVFWRIEQETKTILSSARAEGLNDSHIETALKWCAGFWNFDYSKGEKK